MNHLTVYLGTYNMRANYCKPFSKKKFDKFMPHLRRKLEREFPKVGIYISPQSQRDMIETNAGIALTAELFVSRVIKMDWERVTNA